MESGRANGGSGARGVAVWVWVALGAATCALMTPLEPSLLEEGLLVHFAERMVAGEHLYRDLVFFSGPLPFEALALLFRWFGEEIAVGRMALAVLSGLATGAVYSLAARAGAGALAAAAAAGLAVAPILLFPLYSSWFYTTLAMHGSVLAAWATLRGVRSDGWCGVAGIAVAAVALCKQSVGVVTSLGLLATLVWVAPAELRRRRAGAMLAGAGALALATLGLYALRGDLSALLDALVVLPLSLESSFASPGVNYWPVGRFAPEVEAVASFYLPHLYRLLTGEEGAAPAPVVAATQLLFALPWIALLATGLRRAYSGPLPAAVWMHAVVLLAGLSNLSPRADWGHLAFALPAAVCQLWIAAAARPLGSEPRREGALRLPALAVLLAAAVTSLPLALRLYRLAEPSELGPRVPQRGVSRVHRDPALSRVAELLRERARPGEPVFVARSEPLLYFATGTRNPTPYGGVLPARRERQSQRILEALGDVRFVVMSEIDQPAFLYYRDELPAVQAYLERFFRLAPPFEGRASWIVVLERGGDRGETLVDLFDVAAGASAWIRDATGQLRRHRVAPPSLATRANRRPLPILLGAGGGGLDYELEIPADALLRADIGLARLEAPGGVRVHARGVHLAVAVREGDAPFHELASWPVEGADAAGRAWTPVELDLAALAGRRVTLRLAAVGERPLRAGTLAWWGSPVIVRR
jgi:hypothetical protein